MGASLLCWHSTEYPEKSLSFPRLSLLAVWVSCESLEEENMVFPQDGLSQPSPEQSRFVNQCWGERRGGVECRQAFPLPRRPWLRRHPSVNRGSQLYFQPASSPLTHSVMPQSNVYDLTADHHGSCIILGLVRSKTRVEILDSLEKVKRRPLFIETTC